MKSDKIVTKRYEKDIVIIVDVRWNPRTPPISKIMSFDGCFFKSINIEIHLRSTWALGPSALKKKQTVAGIVLSNTDLPMS